MRNIAFVLIATFATYLTTPQIFAQQGTGNTPATTSSQKRLSIRTLCAAYQKHIREIEIAIGKEERLKFPLYDDAFSPAQTYKGAMPIHIYETGAEKPFTSVTPTLSSGQLILLFVPTSKDSDQPYRVITMDGSNKNFPYGMRRMFNFTRSDIAIKYGKTAKTIPKGTTPQNILIKENHVSSKRFPIEFFDKTGTQWKRFSATRWSVNPSKRSIVIFHQHPRTGRPTYRSIAEYYVDPALVQNRYARGQKQAEEDQKKEQPEVHSEETPTPRPANRGKGKTVPPVSTPQ